ncbi:MAG: hypothetical protein KAR42_15410 [candidate division Zixibacteria bacterium]|nr:hypothetical protein [candidate division Zixibacteria bacterium]
MADQIVLVDASVEVDDEAYPVIGNTIVFTEGNGETSVTAASQGGRPILVASQDITTKVSTVKFEVPSSVEMMNKSREIGAKGIGRVIRISGTDAGGNRLGRTFRSAALVTDPEKSIQNEGTIPMEFKASPAVPS